MFCYIGIEAGKNRLVTSKGNAKAFASNNKKKLNLAKMDLSWPKAMVKRVMANRKKIVGEVEKTIVDLLTRGFNPYAISHEVGISKETIKKYAKENNLPLNNRADPEMEAKKKKFIELLKDGNTLTVARKAVDIGAQTAQDIVNQNSLRHLVRTRKEASQDKTIPITEAQERIPAGEGEIVRYENKKFIIQCSDGFIYKKSLTKLYQGDPRKSNRTRWTLEVLKKFLKERGYTYVSGFKIARKSFLARHDVCNTLRESKVLYFDLYECSTCNNIGVSKIEIQMARWVESLGFKTKKRKLKNNRTKHRNIDIQIEDTKLNIEINGGFYHSEAKAYEELIAKYRYKSVSWDDLLKFEKRIHTIRHDPCRKAKEIVEMGESLLTIYDTEILNREPQIKNLIKSKLGIHDHRVFARQCQVKEIQRAEATPFIEQNHIQSPSKRGIVWFGLFFQDRLVGVVEGAEHHRNKEGILILSRLCFLDGYQVVGGASKLFKSLTIFAKTEGFKKVVSWSDNRWSEGNVYQKMGFTLEEELAPDYSYYRQGKIYSKQSLKKNPKKDDMSKTEYELRLAQGYYRIYDCGKKRWGYDLI